MRRRIGSTDPFEVADAQRSRVRHGATWRRRRRRRARRCCRSGGPGRPGRRRGGARRGRVGDGVGLQRGWRRRRRRRSRGATSGSSADHGAHELGQRRRRRSPAATAARPAASARAQHGGGPALGRREADVAARAGPARRPRARWGTRRSRRAAKVGRHAAHHGQLLEVLLAEVGAARARPWRTAWPPPSPRRRSGPGVRRPPSASLTPRTETVVAGGAGQVGYISATGGTNTTSTPCLAADVEVALEGARVVRHVLGVAELQRVDEDAHGDDVALGTRPAR